jgi:omega-6 fatty acid desaturase (delta-12 desaturase)
MKKHVLQYSQPDDKTAWLMLALSIAIEGVAIAFIHMGYRLIGWSIHTLCLVRLFIQFHDMAHFSYFSSIQTNTIVGKLIGVLTHQPFNAWRDGHNHHHKHYGNLDKPDLSQTILFTKKQY